MPKLIELGLPSLTPGINSILASQGTTAGNASRNYGPGMKLWLPHLSIFQQLFGGSESRVQQSSLQ
jgi:hypothetical protein